MKRFLALAVVLMLVFTLVPAGFLQAAVNPEGTGNQVPPLQNPEVAPGSENTDKNEPSGDVVTTPVQPVAEDGSPQENPDKEVVTPVTGQPETAPTQGTYTLLLEHQRKGKNLFVRASIKEIPNGRANGTWTFQLGDKTIERTGRSPQQQAEFKLTREDLRAGTVHLIEVRFDGQIKGNAYRLHEEDTFKIPHAPGADELALGYGIDHQGVVINAKLPNAERATGTWTFTLNGETKTLTNVEGPSQQAILGLNDAQPGKRYVARVTFKGTAEGKEFSDTNDIPVRYVHVRVSAACTDKGVIVQGELQGADKAKAAGVWTLILDGDKRFEDHTGNTEAPVHRTAFDKKEVTPGEYLVHADYQGKMADGGFIRIYDVDNLTLKAGSPCVTPPEGGGRPGDGDDGETPDDGEESPAPDQDQETDKIGNGGNLPGTSVSYPTGLLVGGILALTGLAALVLRRRTKKG